MPPFDWDENKQQPKGADACAGFSAFLGMTVAMVILTRLGMALIPAVLIGALLGLPLQWLIMLTIFPIIVGTIRWVWGLFGR